MTRGLNRRQIGVTEVMFETFGEIIFRMSHNHQVREGDPYREKDWDEIDRHRELMGLSDAQIADRIGLSRNQVLYIRTLMERRRFRTGHYARLLDLGGGKRFRAERFTPHLDHFRYSEDALELRAAMNYPPDQAREYIEKGWWRNETQRQYLERHAAERPDAPAFVLLGRTLTWKELRDTAERVAKGLWQLGLRPGDVVAVQLPNIPEFAIANLAVTWFGGVVQTVHMPYRDAELQTLINHGRSRAIVCMGAAKDWSAAQAALELQPQLPTLKHVIAVGDVPEGTLSLDDLIAADPDVEIGHEPSAADPYLLLYTSGTTSSPKGVPLNAHNMLSNARMSAPEKGLTAADSILTAAAFTHLYGLYAFHLGIATGMAKPAAARLHAARPRPGHRNHEAYRGLVRAGPRCGHDGGRPDRATRFQQHEDVPVRRQRLAAGHAARLAESLARLPGLPALGHDRVAGRHVHPAGRRDRKILCLRWPRLARQHRARRRPRNRRGTAARRRRRNPDPRPDGVPGLPAQQRGQRDRLHRRPFFQVRAIWDTWTRTASSPSPAGSRTSSTAAA